MSQNNTIEMFEGYGEYSLNQYPKILIKLKYELEKVGIKKVKIRSEFNSDSVHRELTLYTKPRTREGGMYLYGLKKLKGCNSEEIAIYHGEREKIFLKIDNKDLEIGCYIKERNIFIIYANIFYSNLVLGLDNECIFLQVKAITDYIKKKKIKKVSTKKYEQNKILREFSENVQTQINDLRGKITGREDSIITYRAEIINYFQANTIDKEILKTLIKMKDKVEDLVKKHIREIKSLKFVKSVDLFTKGIKIDVGEIKIENISLGEFYIYIKPRGITIENKKPLRRECGEPIHHPHIKNPSNICYGNRKDKIDELLARGDYKKLVYFLYLFLKSYNKEDKYYSTKYWELVKDGMTYYNGSDEDNEGDGDEGEY